ncbi:MAG: bacterial Ig-like domain-containing protein [Oscillospiraceae bacterium]|nr:bacterial Ig-like domain-containing protein [Oscillospiraceae bacterium]
MKKKKLLAAALALLLTLSLAPFALAAELPFPAEWFSGFGAGISLRDMIDENRGSIELGGSAFQLENILFVECVVDEKTELCVCETAKDAMVLDENTLPAGLEVEIRREKVRKPDAKDGLEVAEEIRLEKAGRKPEPKTDEEIDPADRDREAYYLYLVGKPQKVGESVFVLWDGQIRLVNVTVLAEKPAEESEQTWVEEQAEPAQEWVDPFAPTEQSGDQGQYTEEWADTSKPMEQSAIPEPVIPQLPTPSVTISGNTNAVQGNNAMLTAQVQNGVNVSYQWYINNTPIEDGSGNGAQYWPDTSVAGTYTYTCAAINRDEYNQMTYAFSEPFTFTVEAAAPALPTPSVTVSGDAKVTQGADVVLTAQVQNGYNVSYQWYDGEQPINGETSGQFKPDTAQAGTKVYYCLAVNNGDSGEVTYAFSQPFTFTVEAALPTPKVSITGKTTVEQGENAVLEVQVSDVFNASYQWYEDSAPIADAIYGKYQPDTSKAGTYTYVCEVTSSANGQTATAYSDPVTVTVEAKPTLPTPKVTVSGNTKAYVGDNAVLYAQVSDDYNAGYQWYAGRDAINGATGKQYKPDTSRPGTWTYSCVVTNSGYGTTTSDFASVNFTVEAPPLDKPTVTIAGNNRVSTGDNAVLEARVRGGSSNVSYQWYIGLGNYWAPIDDRSGKSAQYKPDTSKAGDYAYYCEITSSDNYGQSVTVKSDPVSFTVVEKTPVTRQIKSVKIYSQPKKVRYNDGDTLDTTGLQLRVDYSDGGADIVTSGFLATPQTVSYAYSNNGVVTVTVNYKGYSDYYRVNVLSQQQSIANMVRDIAVQTFPNKTRYTVGDYLDTTGLKIRVWSAEDLNKYLDIGEGFTYSPTRLTSVGTQRITVSFAGKTCYFDVMVSEARPVYTSQPVYNKSMTIQSLPANRSYTVGDTINPSGLVLQVQTNSGTQTVTSGYTITPRVAATAGTQTVTVLYEGMSTTYTVNVNSAQAPRATAAPTPTLPPYGTVTPTPVPFGTPTSSAMPFPSPSTSPLPFGTVTPTPSASPSAAPSARPTATPARTNTGVSTLVKVLFGVSVLALGGLIGYILYLRKTGYEDDYDTGEPSPSEKLHNLFNKKDRK